MKINYNKASKRPAFIIHEKGTVAAISVTLKQILALRTSYLSDRHPEIDGQDMVELDHYMKCAYLL